MKKNVYALIFTLICVFAGGFAHALGLDGSPVLEVKATGSQVLSEKQILAVTRLKKGDPLNPSVVNADIKRIWKMNLFDSVEVQVEEADTGVILTYVVAEKPVIKEIRFSGNKQYSDGKLKGKTDLEVDQTYDAYKVAEAIRKIEEFYKEKDYYSIQVSVKRRPSKEKGKVILQFSVEEGIRMKIESVQVDGNKVFSDSKIRGAMADTKETNIFNFGGSFSRENLKKDLENVLRLYVKEGYLKATVEGYSLSELPDHADEVAASVVEFDEENRSINIRFKVSEGIRYTLKALEFSGNEIFKTKKLKQYISAAVGKVFDQEKWENEDIRAVRRVYANKGYIFADAIPSYTWDDDKGEVSVAVRVSEGNKAYIEKIKIVGNEITKDKVIRRQVAIEPGEPFDADRLGETQRKIFNLGFFENVAIDTQPGSEVDKLVLVIDVSPERKTGTLSLGAGYSSVEGLVGFLQVSQSNLFGNGQSVSAQWDFGNRKTSYTVSFTEPWLLNTPTSFGIDIFSTEQTQDFNTQGYNLRSTGGSLRLGRILTPKTNYWRVFNVYRYQSDDITGVIDSLAAFIPVGVNNISSITPSIVRDTRDNRFDANRGSEVILSTQLAGGILGGDNNFFKPVLDIKLHYTTPAYFGQKWLRRFVLGIHGRAGYSQGFDAGRGLTDVPPSERFFMGGTDTVRGYEERILGDSARGGGRLSLLTNVEYGFKPAPPVKIRAFYDSGNTWREPGSVDWKNLFLYPSWGVGMLFTIPGSVIQIRLDIGFPLIPTGAYNTPEEGPLGKIGKSKIHFNIGNIF